MPDEFVPSYGDFDTRLRNLEQHAVSMGSSPVDPAVQANAPVTVVTGASLPSLIPESSVVFDAASGHAHDGSDSHVVALAGDLTGDNTAAVVAKANGKTLPAPVTADDAKELAYDDAGGQYVLRRHKEKVLSKTATYTATLNDTVILVDATGGAVTINLPAAATAPDHILTVKKIDASANAVTLDGAGAETIDGAATQAIAAQWGRYRIVCNATAWFILGA